jgi:hypothetical protein
MKIAASSTVSPAPIAALTEAAEFLMCAVRAMAWGADADSQEVRQVVAWAMSKMKEAGVDQLHPS